MNAPVRLSLYTERCTHPTNEAGWICEHCHHIPRRMSGCIDEAPANHILSDSIELYARRTGPLTIAETYRNADVTAQCDLCERRMLKRHLLFVVKLGVTKCFNGCATTARMEEELRVAKNATEREREDVSGAMAAARALNRKYERRASLAPAPAPVPTPKPSPVLKTCRCCGAKYTHADWLRLPMLSVSEVTEDGVVELHDMRNCACGSTLLMISEREKGTGIYYREGES